MYIHGTCVWINNGTKYIKRRVVHGDLKVYMQNGTGFNSSSTRVNGFRAQYVYRKC